MPGHYGGSHKKSTKESIAWDFCSSFGSYIFSLLKREGGTAVYKIRIRGRLSP